MRKTFVAIIAAIGLAGCATPQERFAKAMMRGANGDEAARSEAAWCLLRGIGTDKNVPRGLNILDIALSAREPNARKRLNDWVYAVLQHAELEELPFAMSRLCEAYGHHAVFSGEYCTSFSRAGMMDYFLVRASIETIRALSEKDDLATAIAVRDAIRNVSLKNNGEAERQGVGGRFEMTNVGSLVVHHEEVVRDHLSGKPVPEFFAKTMSEIDELLAAACERIARREMGLEADGALAERNPAVSAAGTEANTRTEMKQPLEKEETKTVRARGIGISVSKAKAEAVRNAVLQIAGEQVSRTIEIANDELVLDRIESRSSGAVDGWEVVEGPDKAEDGLVRIVMDVRVRNRFLRDDGTPGKQATSISLRKGALEGHMRLHDKILAIREKAEREALSVPARWDETSLRSPVAGEDFTPASTDKLAKLKNLLEEELPKLVFCDVRTDEDGAPVVNAEKPGAFSVRARIGVSLERYNEWERTVENTVVGLLRPEKRAVARVVLMAPSVKFDPFGKKRTVALGEEAARLFAAARLSAKAVVALFDTSGRELARREIPFDDAPPDSWNRERRKVRWRWIVAGWNNVFYVAPGAFETSWFTGMPTDDIRPYPFGNKTDRDVVFDNLSADAIRRIETIRAWTEIDSENHPGLLFE